MPINADELRRYLISEHDLQLSKDDPVIALFLGHQAILDQYTDHWRDTVLETTENISNAATDQLEALSKAQERWSTELQRDLVKMQRDNLELMIQKLNEHLKEHEAAVSKSAADVSYGLKIVTWALATVTGLALISAILAW